MSHTAIRLTPAEKFMKEGGGAIRVRICTPDISGGVPGEKCRSRHVQVCYGIPRRQILHCEDRYVSLYMSVDYFEDQRREMVTAIRAIADHVAAQQKRTGQAGPGGHGQRPSARVCAGRGSAVRLPEQAAADWLR
jgi:hypothetical protein